MDVKPGNAMLSVSVSYQIYTQDKQQQGWANCTSMVTLWRPSYKPVPKNTQPKLLTALITCSVIMISTCNDVQSTAIYEQW